MTATDLLVDISDFMTGKQQAAKRLLADEVLPALDFSCITGMKTFLSILDSPIIISSLDLENNSQSAFRDKLDGLPMPNGGAPIAKTVEKSVSQLDGVEADDKRIIIVTAGAEKFRYEMQDVASELKKAKDKIRLMIIGLGLSDFDVDEAVACVSEFGGVVCNINMSDDDYNSYDARTALMPLVDALNNKSFASVSSKNVDEEKTVRIDEKPVAETVSIPVEEKKVEVHEKSDSVFKNIVGKLFGDVQDKAEEEKIEVAEPEKETDVFEVLGANNNAIVCMLQNNVEAVKALSKKLDDANAEIAQLKQDDLDVVIREDEALNASIAEGSRAILASYLNEKYPGRVNALSGADAGCDFEVMLDDSKVEYKISCKGDMGVASTFFLTQKEWQVCMKNNRNYQVYIVNNIGSTPTLTIIDNLMGWLLAGKVIPCASINKKVKSGMVMLSLV